jgi:hypothetical protein
VQSRKPEKKKRNNKKDDGFYNGVMRSWSNQIIPHFVALPHPAVHVANGPLLEPWSTDRGSNGRGARRFAVALVWWPVPTSKQCSLLTKTFLL